MRRTLPSLFANLRHKNPPTGSLSPGPALAKKRALLALHQQRAATAVYAGDTVGFAVAVQPETAVPPFTYTVSISGTAVLVDQPAASAPFAFDHLFAGPGSYPLLLDVWNCGLSTPVSAGLEVAVLPATERYKLYLPGLVRE